MQRNISRINQLVQFAVRTFPRTAHSIPIYLIAPLSDAAHFPTVAKFVSHATQNQFHGLASINNMFSNDGLATRMFTKNLQNVWSSSTLCTIVVHEWWICTAKSCSSQAWKFHKWSDTFQSRSIDHGIRRGFALFCSWFICPWLIVCLRERTQDRITLLSSWPRRFDRQKGRTWWEIVSTYPAQQTSCPVSISFRSCNASTAKPLHSCPPNRCKHQPPGIAHSPLWMTSLLLLLKVKILGWALKYFEVESNTQQLKAEGMWIANGRTSLK